jgi:hypothetical protein
MTGLVDFANNGGLGLSLPTDIFAWNNGGTSGALDLHDYFKSGDLGNPDRTTWADRTREYLDDPANSDVNVIIWSWCGQADTTEENINLYLSLMSQLEIDYPDVNFVYMTGHANGTGETGNLHLRNQQIRNYCIANNKVLYDFYDIECYDPDGSYFGDKLVNDNCDYDSDGNGSRDANWAIEWQNSHTEGVDWYDCASAHSQPLNANRKAYAAWWMLARLAGWNPDGEPGDELAIDFGTYGLWHYDGTGWMSLAGWDPEIMIEWDSKLTVDFGIYGLWIYNGVSWTNLAGWDPEGMEVYDTGLAVDFDINGLWYYDGSTWSSLASWDPEGMEAWANGLAVDFGIYGLWHYDGSTWTSLAEPDPEGMEPWGNALVVDFGIYGLRMYDGSSWTSLAGWNPDGTMKAWAIGLTVDFGSFGLWNYYGSSWTNLSGWNPDKIEAYGTGLAVDFDTYGLWYYNGSAWTSLAGWDPEDMEAWGGGLTVDFGTDGLWNYDGSAWTSIAGWDPEDMIDIDLF